MDVLEDKHEWSATLDHVLDEHSKTPRDLAVGTFAGCSRRVGQTDDLTQPSGDIGVGADLLESGSRIFGGRVGVDSREVSDHLGDRPVGDPVAVGQAASPDHRPAFVDEARGRFPDKPALPHSGHADDGEECGLAPGQGATGGVEDAAPALRLGPSAEPRSRARRAAGRPHRKR